MKYTRSSKLSIFHSSSSSWIHFSFLICICWLTNHHVVITGGCEALSDATTTTLFGQRRQSFSSTTTLSATPDSSSSSSPIPPPPALSVPVWSLAVVAKNDDSDNKTNMNIMTYCMPVSIGPPKLWALSLYKDTLTREVFLKQKTGILQLLTRDQHALVSILGKQSGRDLDKQQACEKEGWKWASPPSEESSLYHETVLPSCALYLQVQVVEEDSSSSKPTMMLDAGDHWVALCQVVNTGQWNATQQCIQWNSIDETMDPIDENNAMYSGWLRQEGHL